MPGFPPLEGGTLDPTLTQIAWLAVAALLSGVVDAIAGGGGLITVPALLAVGMPPHLALGTNKGQAVFGSFAALVNFSRAGLVNRRRALVAFPLGLVGSLVGAALVLLLDPAVLRPLVLVLLVAVALFMAFRPKVGASADPGSIPERTALVRLAILAFVVGAYDGFFGPGTGTFLIVGFVALLALPMARASANAKVVNFASNLAAMCLFASKGVVLWKVALPMAAAQFVGGFLGAHLAMKGGDVLVRRVVLFVVMALVLKIGHDLWV